SLADGLAALNRYRGDFLQHFTLNDAPEFMEWATAQRAYWARCYDLLTERVMGHLMDEGHADDACLIGQNWVKLHPDNELAYRLLASAQAMSGDRGAAQLTLETAAHHLTEFEVMLSPETIALRDHLASGAITDNPSPQTLRLPFVGRGEAFSH